MNCFIASAFGYSDVDEIYDKIICPVLKGLGLRPFRVDRVEHNDDIDDQIFSLIDRCQVCIADLTYARPSVYYEAGYAFGNGKPVIYIARADHFRARENDRAGNLRVHFDLQMKNIISWTESHDAFKRRLQSRLKHVIKPLLEQQEAADAEHHCEKAFAALSQNEQLTALRSKAVNLLRSRGYSRGASREDRRLGYGLYDTQLKKTSKKTYHQVHVLIRPSVNKADLKFIRYLWLSMLSKEEYEAVKRIESTCLIISLSPTRTALIKAQFPNWTPIDERTYSRSDFRSLGEDIPESAIITVMDSIRSVEQFSEKFRAFLQRFEGQ